jgi:hypothetical protein
MSGILVTVTQSVTAHPMGPCGLGLEGTEGASLTTTIASGWIGVLHEPQSLPSTRMPNRFCFPLGVTRSALELGMDSWSSHDIYLILEPLSEVTVG